jgi:hypothetical protein
MIDKPAFQAWVAWWLLFFSVVGPTASKSSTGEK